MKVRKGFSDYISFSVDKQRKYEKKKRNESSSREKIKYFDVKSKKLFSSRARSLLNI